MSVHESPETWQAFGIGLPGPTAAVHDMARAALVSLRVIIDREPGIDTRPRFLPPDTWGDHEWDTMTAMTAMHAIPGVHDAPSGILGLPDAGLTVAPAGLWSRR